MEVSQREFYLSALRPEDAAVMVHWRNDPDVASMVVAPHRFVSLETEQAWNAMARAEHEQGRRVCLTARFTDDDSLMGLAQLVEIDRVNRKCAYGYIVGDPRSRGKGHGKRMTARTMAYAFQEVGMHAVRCRVLVDNLASVRVLTHVGFRYEGCEREALFKGGGYKDVGIYSLLRSEFKYDGPSALLGRGR